MKSESTPVKVSQRAPLLGWGTLDGRKVPLGAGEPNLSGVGQPGAARYSSYGIRLRPRT